MTNPFLLNADSITSLTLLKWIILEQDRLKAIAKPLPQKARFGSLFKSYYWILLLTITLFLINVITLPLWRPSLLVEGGTGGMQTIPWENWQTTVFRLMLQQGGDSLVFLGGSLLWAMLITWRWGLAWGLTWGLALGLINGLSLGGAIEAIGWTTTGIIWGGVLGLVAGMKIKLNEGLAFSVVLMLLTGGSVGGFFWLREEQVLAVDAALSLGISTLLTFNLIFFRLIIWPFYWIRSFFHNSLLKNPYLHDQMILIGLGRVDRALLKQSWEDPPLAYQFSDFLLNNRPLQKRLAYKMGHAATASLWYQYPMNPNLLRVPPLPPGAENMRPSARWLDLLEALRDMLAKATTPVISLSKPEEYNEVFRLLEDLERATIHESKEWNSYYLKAIRKWKIITAEDSMQFPKIS